MTSFSPSSAFLLVSFSLVSFEPKTLEDFEMLLICQTWIQRPPTPPPTYTHITLLPSLSLHHLSYKKLLPQKYVQFQLYQWQAFGTEHTDKQAKRNHFCSVSIHIQ